MAEGMTTAAIDIDGVHIHYQESGSGPAVIMLHGGGPGASGMSNFNRNIDAIVAAGYRVIVPDMPGFGRSSKVNGPEGTGLLTFLAQTLLAFIDKVGIGQAHIVGNSLGGGVALKAALDRNAAIGKLILLGPAGGFSPLTPFPTEGLMSLAEFYAPPGPSVEKMKRFIRYLVFDPTQISDALIEDRVASASDPEVLAMMRERAQRGFKGLEPIWLEDFGRVANETLILWGREDRTNSWDQGIILSKLLPNATLHVMPKTGHWVQWERADRFNRLVIDFLND